MKWSSVRTQVASFLVTCIGFGGSCSDSSAANFNNQGSTNLGFVLPGGFLVSPPSEFNPLGGSGLFTTSSISYDYSDIARSVQGDAAVYGGGGIEPMAFSQIAAQVNGVGNSSMVYTARAAIAWPHRVDALPGAPVVDRVPVQLKANIGQTELHGQADVEICLYRVTSSGGACGGGNTLINRRWTAAYGGTNSWDFVKGQSAAYEEDVTLTANLFVGAEYVIQVKSTASANLDGASRSEVVSVVDPFLVVDPTWESGAFFQAVQRTSAIDPLGVPVSREWMTSAVPEPHQWAFLLCGLIVLRSGLRRNSSARPLARRVVFA